ncbi:MAG: hypothetical protein ACHP65_04000 [Legionellales bacterium]
MPNILYWSEVLTKKELEGYKLAINKMCTNWKNSCVVKLKEIPCYSYPLNSKDRLLFNFIEVRGKAHLIFLAHRNTEFIHHYHRPLLLLEPLFRYLENHPVSDISLSSLLEGATFDNMMALDSNFDIVEEDVISSAASAEHISHYTYSRDYFYQKVEEEDDDDSPDPERPKLGNKP